MCSRTTRRLDCCAGMETSRPSRTNAERTASSAGSSESRSGGGAASAAALAASPKRAACSSSARPSRRTRPARASRRAASATSLSGSPDAWATSSRVPAPSASAATTLRRVGSASSPTRVAASTPRPYALATGAVPVGSVSMTSARGFTEDMRLAHVLADQADSISMERFKAQDLVVDTKPDLTPVTDADRAVEEQLRITLSRARIRDAVEGEEFGTTGHGSRRWVLDPIDGTKNFVRGGPVWPTLIALFDGDEPVVGCVSAPALNRRWWAAKDVGAWTGRRLESATRCRVSGVTELADASLSYSSLSGWEERDMLGGFLDLTRSVWRTRAYGDFWSYVLLAEGAVDVACEPEVSVWDLAALDVIVREAGGRFTDLSGTPGPDGGSALATNGVLHDAALRRLRIPATEESAPA